MRLIRSAKTVDGCPQPIFAHFKNLNPIDPEDGGNNYLRAANYVVVGAPETQDVPGKNAANDMPSNSTDEPLPGSSEHDEQVMASLGIESNGNGHKK